MNASFRVPSKDYAVQYRDLLGELMPALERAFLSDDPILGEATDRFERAFAEYLGVAHVVGVNSGTDALILALRALGVGPGDEVVTNANTFIATVSAIHLVGARPVLVDPDPDTMAVTAVTIESAATPRTRAFLPAHLYGFLPPMDGIVDACRRLGVALVEDAAQAHGAIGGDGRRAGTYGAAGCFSFHPSKNLGAFGDAGAIATSDETLAARLRRLRNLGKETKHEVRHLTTNTKLDTLQAVILELKLPRLDAWNGRRRQIAARYDERLSGIGDLVLPPRANDGSHVYHLYVVRTERRDALRDHLKRRGVNAGLHYPIPPHRQRLDVDLGYAEGDFPVAEACARTVLSLPVSPELTDAQIDVVCDEVDAFFGGAA